MSINDYVVISVESRKGGVGKTTAAMNLAKLLEKGEFAVLFVDADVTGTNVTHTLNSPFWQGRTNELKDDKGSSNLLEWFERCFMSGKGWPDIAKQIKPDKINIIGSQVYSENSKADSRHTKLICSPSLLFDELHSFWFIEFLRRLSEDFAKVSGRRRNAIIIDNSPGFIGIGPAVHEWLTDLGPVRGKFLTVSSLDQQDLAMCCYSVSDIHQRLGGKIETAKVFHEAMANSSKDIKEWQNSFFIRLVEEKCESVKSDLGIYLTPTESKHLAGFEDNPGRYQNWIINRVPRDVGRRLTKDGVYEILAGQSSDLAERIWQISDSRRPRRARPLMVPYDEYIEYQYLRNMLSGSSDRHKRRRWRGQETVHRVFAIAQENMPSPKNPFDKRTALNGAECLNVLQTAKTMQHWIDDTLDRAARIGYSHITRLVRNEWRPMQPLNQLREDFYDMLRSPEFPPFEFGPLWRDMKGAAEDESEKAYASVVLNRFYGSFSTADKVEQLRQRSYILDNSLAACVVFLMAGFGDDHPFVKELPSMFARFLAMQKQRVERVSRDRRPLLQSLLLSDEMDEKDLHMLEVKFPFPFRHMDESGDILATFYSTLCRAQVRLIDMEADARFLLEVLMHAVMSGEDTIVGPYIRPLLDDVIEKKTLSHEQGRKRIPESFAEANYMAEFEDVLRGVVAKWGLTADEK